MGKRGGSADVNGIAKKCKSVADPKAVPDAKLVPTSAAEPVKPSPLPASSQCVKPVELADDAQLAACCEGPREWYLADDGQLRQAFSKEHISRVIAGSIKYMQYPDGTGKYADNALQPGDQAPNVALLPVDVTTIGPATPTGAAATVGSAAAVTTTTSPTTSATTSPPSPSASLTTALGTRTTLHALLEGTREAETDDDDGNRVKPNQKRLRPIVLDFGSFS